MSDPSDDKDWTWVLERPCVECETDVTSLPRDELGASFRANAATWRQLLSREQLVDRRPRRPDGTEQWSALEYGAHVRDVYGLFAERVTKMLKKKNPQFANWDQDLVAIDENYRDQDANKVAYGLAVNAGKVADIYDRLRDDEWNRTGQRSDGATFTVESIGRYLLHDVEHHVVDVEKGYDALFE